MSWGESPVLFLLNIPSLMHNFQSEPFVHEVDDSEFPEYKKYIIQPMDLTLLQHNIKENLYGSTQAFEADAKWILHNSIVFNSCKPLSSIFLYLMNWLEFVFYVPARLGIVIKIRERILEVYVLMFVSSILFSSRLEYHFHLFNHLILMTVFPV